MSLIRTFAPQEELPPAIGAAVFDLANWVWPPAFGGPAPDLEADLAGWKSQGSAHFVLGEAENPVLAHALIFRREVFTAQGPLAVGALATVCVHPGFRGRGWGEAIVRAAFEFLPELGAGVSLFQTGVPAFYEKLGGRVVTNRFFNGDDPKNPFWDACEMIYPATFAWPDGDIDLNGPGY